MSMFEQNKAYFDQDKIFDYIEAARGICFFLFLLAMPIFHKTLFSVVCCKSDELSQYVLNFQYEGFLSSQMNMELVCSLLQGIQKTIEQSRHAL